jgi:Na+-driven multidrug efflux pump
MYATGVGALTHFLLVMLLYVKLDLGFTAICWATNGMYVVRAVVSISLVWYSGRFPHPEGAEFFSRNTVKDLWPQLILCLKSTGTSVWTWWASDVFTIMSSYLGTDILAAQTCVRSIQMFVS